jgi:hypothetical protein
MLKRVVQVVLAVVLLAVVAAPNIGVSTPTPVLIAGDDPGGGTGG